MKKRRITMAEQACRQSRPGPPGRRGPLLKFGRNVPAVRRVPIALARRFSQICTAAAAESLAGSDLTPQEFGVLAYINKIVGEPEIDQSSLAARLGIDHAHTSLRIDRLESRGLLERRVNGDDRRARLLRLTRRGENLFARLGPQTRAGQERILAVLAPAERELLLDLLVRVIENNRELARPGAGRRKRGSGQSRPGEK